MNKRQKEVAQHHLDSEKAVLKQLERQYTQALNDINRKIVILQSDELTQSRIYRIEYQKALKKQTEAILEKLHSDEYTTIQQFLSESYTDAFVGAAYDMHGQGVPLIMPIDPAEAVRAIQTESKINEGLYDSLGVDTKHLKKSISSEITRGIAAGMATEEIARNLRNVTKAPLSRAKTIVRTESHRIQQASCYNAQKHAKSKGADVLKMWDATMDAVTRPSHRRLDGQIKGIDEPFEIGGKKAMYPGDFGDPAEDCNCRCQSLQRARWALDEGELQTLKDRAEFFGLDKTKEFDEFKTKYLSASNIITLQQDGQNAKPPQGYDGVFDDFAELDLTKTEKDALSALWSASKETGFEYGLVIENGKISKAVTSNMASAVKIPLEGFGSDLTVLHSHTNATPPSATDFQRLLDEKVDKIGVIGYNGDVYMAYIGYGETPDIDEFNATVRDISRQVDFELIDNPEFFDWSIEERNYMAIREQAYRIALHYGWTLEGGRMNVK